MYRGFTINYSSVKRLFDNDHNHKWAYYYGIGRRVVQDKSKKVFKKVLDKLKYYITEDILDGTAIQDDWFPQKQCDIFISHSHKDENLAIALAGWLTHTFGLKAFVDSCIWGYVDELVEMLKKLDESGNESNYINSHVHNMLTVALMEMIDKTECLFFLKTPNSTFFDGTLSPWIYTEIGISKMIQKRIPQRQKQISDSKKFSIGYEADLSHLTEINFHILNEWKKLQTKRFHPLDTLYNLTKYRKKRTINV